MPQGNPFKIGVMTGASTGRSLDGALAQADARRCSARPTSPTPTCARASTQARPRSSTCISRMMPQDVRYGFLGPVHYAVIEACDVSESGEITLTSAVGAAPTFCRVADKIIIELNRFHPRRSARLPRHLRTGGPALPQSIARLPTLATASAHPIDQGEPDKILGIVETQRCRMKPAPSARSPKPPRRSATTSPSSSPPKCKRGLIPKSLPAHPIRRRRHRQRRAQGHGRSTRRSRSSRCTPKSSRTP